MGTYTLDIASGLTQVLEDGTNDYAYRNGHVAQINENGRGYFLDDALGSERQMADASGKVTLSTIYKA